MVQLRQYQIDCIEQARKLLRQGIRRIILQMDTGAGKTPVACEIMRLTVENGNRALFLAHARELVNQCSAKLDWFGLPHGILMARRGYNLHEPIQVGSTGTAISRILRRKTLEPPPANLVCLDEAHRQGNATKQLLALYPRAAFILLTATPCRTDGRGLGGPNGAQAIIQPVMRSQLIAEGFLVPTKVYAPYRPDMTLTAEERKLGIKATGADGDYTPIFRARRMDRPELVGDIITQWKRHGEGRPTIFFGSTVGHSIHVAASFNAAGIPAVHLDAQSEDTIREEILGGPDGPGLIEKGKVTVLCNYAVAVEGLDLPCVGCIIMGRPTKSFIVFKQAVGRACRPYTGPLYQKKYSILLDHSGCWETFGLPDADIVWKLDEGKIEDAIKEKLQKEPPLITCPECSAVFKAQPFCPECGIQLKQRKKRKPIDEHRNGQLVEIPQEIAIANGLKGEQLRRAWQKFLAIAAARDQTCGAALAMFRRETGLLPWNIPALPHVPVGSDQWQRKVRDLFPQYYRGRDR